MKVILSRKGFDGSNGGIPSPIFPDGTMVSLPIPSNDKNKYSDFQINSISYSRILHDLNPLTAYSHCHADPDLDIQRYKRPISGWKLAFGQINASAQYLTNTVKVCPGDLFLFFGNF